MSRSHTNVTIGDQYDTVKRALKENAELTFKIQEMQKEINWLYSELQNIPQAVLDWGYVDITFDRGKQRIKLVQDPTPESEEK